uniref:FmdB family regulatory protein n=1 Tax=Pseudomonas phage Cygsa01 TaxID=3138529 RepID=A0AAU6W5G1_9VIRU
MPLYDYKCSKCEHTFNSLQSVANYRVPCLEPCPSCKTPDTVGRHITGTLSIVSGVGDLMNKTPRDFRDKLELIKKGNLGSKIET